MKMFKKALAAVLLGAMALTMMTGCWGWGAPAAGNSKTAQAVSSVGKGNELATESNTAMSALQTVTQTANITDEDAKAALTEPNTEAGQAALAKLDAVRANVTNMTEFTCSNEAGEGTYDLYIWTNGSQNPTAKPAVNYPYLRKVSYTDHIKGSRLALLVSPSFVKLGVFNGSADDYAHLKEALAGAENGKVGITISQVYGVDVLLVAVPKGTAISQDPAPATK